MIRIDENKLISETLYGLGACKTEGSSALSEEIKKCAEELKKEAKFRFCHKICDLKKDSEFYQIVYEKDPGSTGIYLPSKDLIAYFEGCDRVCIVLSTLGMEAERYMKRVQRLSMSHGVVLDACAGVYLELLTDDAENALNLGPRTYRFCPGYGDLPVELNENLLNLLDGTKQIGVSLTEGGLFLPQKSMLGLIGLGKNNLKKSCGSCIKKETCRLRREGNTCWK